MLLTVATVARHWPARGLFALSAAAAASGSLHRTVMSGASYTPYFSAETLARKPSPIRALQVLCGNTLKKPT